MNVLKQIFSAFREWRKGPWGILLAVVLLLLAVGLYRFGSWKGSQRDVIVYTEHLDEPAVTVDGKERTLRDLSYYVGLQEMEGQKQALRMDEKHPRSYWNTLVKKGRSIKESTREQTIQMAVHDEIFYQMAVKEKTVLSEEEEKALLDHETDFWEDLQEYKGPESLGIDRKQLHSIMERVALAQRYQTLYALSKGADYKDYEYNREGYQEILKNHEYQINHKVWNRIDFANIVVDNSNE